MKRQLFAFYFFVMLLLVEVTSAQQIDTSSYFPLGFWGIWVDGERAPINPNYLTESQWQQEI